MAVPVARESEPQGRFRLPAAPSEISFDADAAALIVIDMQNDFLHPEGWFPAAGIDPTPLTCVIDPIREVAGAMRAVGIRVIWLNWGVLPGAPEVPLPLKRKGSRDGQRPTYGDPSTTGHGRILVQGDWGARTIDELAPDPQDLVVHKHRLTGFHDNELDSVLRNLGVRTLFFAGVNIDRCVYATLCDAAVRGFECVLIEDACATSSPRYVTDAILYLVPLLHGSVTTRAKVLDAFQQPAASNTKG